MTYEMIDRFLRNNLGDDDYAEYSEALDSIYIPKHPWVNLTGEELRNIAREFKGNTQRRFEDHWDEIVAFVREAEAKLKEKNT